jgi:GNAT superfamily N-acetyltransferase
MRVVDLSEERKDLFSLCLEDWSEEAKEAGPKRRAWLDHCQECRGLRAKLVLDDDDVEAGIIQYGPIEHSPADGSGLYFIYCIFVHGYEQGRGDFQRRGMGKALLAAAEEDARQLGATGMAAWGLWLPFWMKASWFRKHGYLKAGRQGLSMLLWKPFSDDAEPPRWIPRSGALPDRVPGKVNVVAFTSGWCLARNLVYERAKRAAEEFGDSVVFQEIDTSDRRDLVRWGVGDAVLIDGKTLQKGPPPSYESIRKVLAKRVARLRGR